MIRSIRLLAVALLASLPYTVGAHLLHEHSATMKIVENSANFVVSIPISALDGVDADNNKLLSFEELEEARDSIVAQFNDGFAVHNGEAIGKPALTFVASPETHNPGAPKSYVVVMQRIFFDAPPLQPKVRFSLFGKGEDENSLTFKATQGRRTETVTITPSYSEHTFFAD